MEGTFPGGWGSLHASEGNMKLVKLEELGRAKRDRPESERAKRSECKAQRARRWPLPLSYLRSSEPHRRPVRRLMRDGQYAVW